MTKAEMELHSERRQKPVPVDARPSDCSLVLVVDLDGTLIRSDMLYETFWSAMALNWATPLIAAASLSGGRAALKHRLMQLGPVDVTLLPYDAQVIRYVRQWRATGRRVMLVTASDQAVAERIGAHLGIFDRVHGSDGTMNLKGPAKAAFLEAQFGRKGFVYIGDAFADLVVWRSAAKAVTVTPSGTLRALVDGLGGSVEHLPATGPSPADYARMMRPQDLIANFLVFLPLLWGAPFPGAVWVVAVLFMAFCLATSGLAIATALLQLAADRAHPERRGRPVAAGVVPIGQASVAGVLLAMAGLISAAALGIGSAAVLAVYMAAEMFAARSVAGTMRRRVLRGGRLALRPVAAALALGVMQGT